MLLLCGLCHTAAFAYGYERDAQSQWGYRPVYNQTAASPEYRFYSTSPYLHSLGESKAKSYTPANAGVRKTAGFGDDPNEETDDEIGIVHPDREDLMPVGDTPWLLMLLLSACYIAFRRKKCSP